MPGKNKNGIFDSGYKIWLADIKTKVRTAQLKAAVKVNSVLLNLYWELGADILAKQVEAKWGDAFVEQLSKDLSSEFPGMKGFSRSNLMYIQKWYLFYSGDNKLVQQPVGLIGQQPVGLIVQQPVALINPHPYPEILQIPGATISL